MGVAVANPAHYAEIMTAPRGHPKASSEPSPATNGSAPTGEVGGINYHPPPSIAKLARVSGGFKVR